MASSVYGGMTSNGATVNLTVEGVDAPFVFVFPTPGASGTFLLTRIVAGHVEELFPKDVIHSELIKAGLDKSAMDVSGIPEGSSILSWYKNIYQTYKAEYTKISVKSKETGQDWTTEARNEYGEKAYLRYLQ